MADDYVQVAADGSGKKIDSSALTRSDTTAVERQRVSIGSDGDPTNMVSVNARGEMHVSVDFTEVLIQLKRIALLLEILTDQPVSSKDVQ